MPFQSAIDNTKQTRIRGGANFTRYLIVHTPDVIMQAQPSSGASGLSNAVITVGTPTSGAVANIKADYTVFVTPTSDYANDLQYRASDCLITYARLDGSGSSVFIGETTFQWTTSQYVTVVKDVRVHQRKLRYIANVQYRDYGITYRTPKPRIYDLYSEVLEITSGSTVSKAFTPSAESMKSGGTISTWSWDTDGNTISTGTSSSQNITVDFTAGTHLVSLTVTDSEGVSNKLSILIAVIPTNYNSILQTGVVIASLSHGEDGHQLSFTKYDDIEPLLPGSMAVVATKIHYADGNTDLYTDMVGWLGEINLSTFGDETYQRTRQADIVVNDIAFLMQSIVVQALPFEYKAVPTLWGELSRVTPLDIAWHVISELSTVSNVAPIDYPSGYTSQVVLEYDAPNGTILDVCRSLAFSNNKGSVQFAPNGELVFDVSLPYATTSVRDAGTVYSDFSTQDCDIIPRYPAPGIFAVEYVNAGATRYDSTQQKMRDFYGRAPAKTENGILEERIEYMVLPQNTTYASSVALVGQLAFDHWHASNENLTMELSNLLGGYIGLRQHQGQWITLDVSAGDLLNTDLTFDSNTRFVVTSVTQEYDPEIGSLVISASARKETGGVANYSIISTELLPALFGANLAPVPNTPAYPLLEESNPDDVYGDEYTDETAGMPNPADSPTAQENQINQPTNPNGTSETILVPLTGETVTTTNTFSSGSSYLITYSGNGRVEDSAPVGTVDFDGGYSSYTVNAGTEQAASGLFTTASGNVVNHESSIGDAFDAIATVTVNLGTEQTVTSLEFRGLHAVGSPLLADLNGLYRVEYLDSASSVISDTGELSTGYTKVPGAVVTAQGVTTHTGTVSGCQYVRLSLITERLSANTQISELDYITVSTTADNPLRGDAFFTYRSGETATDTGVSAGIKRDGAFVPLASVEPDEYSTSHEYSYVVSGSDSTMTFAWTDPDGDTSDNSGNISVRIEELA